MAKVISDTGNTGSQRNDPYLKLWCNWVKWFLKKQEQSCSHDFSKLSEIRGRLMTVTNQLKKHKSKKTKTNEEVCRNLSVHICKKQECLRTKTYSAHGKHVGHHTQMSCLASRRTKSHANPKCDEKRVNIFCHTSYILHICVKHSDNFMY